MSYTKNHDPWASGDSITTTIMDNFETIYAEASTYLAGHNHDDLYQTKTEMQYTYWYSGNDGSGSGADADLLHRSSGNLHASAFAGLGVPPGLVILWYGTWLASIPAGWHLCDGTDGTINLVGRYPVGAGSGSSYSVGGTGGSSTLSATGTMTVYGHSLTIAEMPAHNHPYTDYMWNLNWEWGSWSVGSPADDAYSTRTTPSAGSGTAHTHEGSSVAISAVDCLPHTKVLYYIQKI
jgi:hypothetical protein